MSYSAEKSFRKKMIFCLFLIDFLPIFVGLIARCFLVTFNFIALFNSLFASLTVCLSEPFFCKRWFSAILEYCLSADFCLMNSGVSNRAPYKGVFFLIWVKLWSKFEVILSSYQTFYILGLFGLFTNRLKIVYKTFWDGTEIWLANSGRSDCSKIVSVQDVEVVKFERNK